MFQGDGLNVAVVCHVLCMSAKPGVCPKKLGVGVCAEMCSRDSDCPKNRSAAVMDVDISVCLHIKVFVILCVVAYVLFFFLESLAFCHDFLLCL